MEKFIQLLITDAVVREKFPGNHRIRTFEKRLLLSFGLDWAIDYEPYGSLAATNDFEQRYLPAMTDAKVEQAEEIIEPSQKEDEEAEVVTTRKRGRQRASAKAPKQEQDPVELDVKQEERMQVTVKEEDSPKKKRGRARVSVLSTNKDQNHNQVEIKEETEQTSNDDEPKKRRRRKTQSSTKLSDVEKSPAQTKIKQEDIVPSSDDDQSVDKSVKKRPARARSARKSVNKGRGAASVERKQAAEPRSLRGRKRTVTAIEHQQDTESTMDEKSPKEEEPTMDETQQFVRRSSRPRKATTFEPSSLAAAKPIAQVYSWLI